MNKIKSLVIIPIVAMLAGCAVTPVAPVAVVPAPYVVEPAPVVIVGSPIYWGWHGGYYHGWRR